MEPVNPHRVRLADLAGIARYTRYTKILAVIILAHNIQLMMLGGGRGNDAAQLIMPSTSPTQN